MHAPGYLNKQYLLEPVPFIDYYRPPNGTAESEKYSNVL